MKISSIACSAFMLCAINTQAENAIRQTPSKCLTTFSQKQKSVVHGVVPMAYKIVTGSLLSGEYLNPERTLLFDDGQLYLYQWTTGKGEKITIKADGLDQCIDPELGMDEELSLPSAGIKGGGLPLKNSNSCFIGTMTESSSGSHLFVLCTHLQKDHPTPFDCPSDRKAICKAMQAKALMQETVSFDYDTCLSSLEVSAMARNNTGSHPNARTNTTVTQNSN